METATSFAPAAPATAAAHSQSEVNTWASESRLQMPPSFIYQPELTVGSPDDPQEREAESVAQNVMRMPSPVNFLSAGNAISRECTAGDKKEKLHRKESINRSAPVAPPIVHEVLNSSAGRLLDTDTRSFMEPRFNYNFNDVKIHDSDVAAKSADSINALAYTSGNNIVFNSGQFNTNSDSGKRLLAHELTHVVQQDKTVQSKLIQRSAGIKDTAVTPKPKCGPDVSIWFVDQVNMAMKDPDVMEIKRLLVLAAISLPGGSVTTDNIAEFGATLATLKANKALGSAAPPLNPTINNQLTLGLASAATVTNATVASSVSAGVAGSMLALNVAKATSLISLAALKWRSLVNHGARYDFKAHVMNHPKSPNCPDAGCVSAETGVVTICPGATIENCYESDLIGNIFYALIGKFVGWSELTLQLGSQLAELTDTKKTAAHPAVTWDSPQDTTAIHLGYSLPLPLTVTALCGALASARASLSYKAGCGDCTELTTAKHT